VGVATITEFGDDGAPILRVVFDAVDDAKSARE
jgi:hypothetical protein